MAAARTPGSLSLLAISESLDLAKSPPNAPSPSHPAYLIAASAFSVKARRAESTGFPPPEATAAKARATALPDSPFSRRSSLSPDLTKNFVTITSAIPAGFSATTASRSAFRTVSDFSSLSASHNASEGALSRRIRLLTAANLSCSDSDLRSSAIWRANLTAPIWLNAHAAATRNLSSSLFKNPATTFACAFAFSLPNSLIANSFTSTASSLSESRARHSFSRSFGGILDISAILSRICFRIR